MVNELYPVFLKVHTFDVLIVGGGDVGLEKISFLLKSSPNAKVTLVAKEIKNEIKVLAKDHLSVKLIEREFFNEDLTEMQLVIIATENRALNKTIHTEAKERGILVNVADTPELCDFYMGSIVTKGDLKIGISTNGKSPTIAKRLRELFTDLLPDEIETLISNMEMIRNNIKGDFSKKVKELNKLTEHLINK
ncbi:siroheme synthase [Roseivirga seohaensis subsp. aquiponti]|uniref:precorrin-2 dehydrogenase n=1 Tax=Roseivirga seohaensis subsp. aquiponti TaxID=1566026 RepID=A0A0L8AHS1_9BACT|nr:bifunctional precorrin-2 dehydrogenase/sirohydrochlorin ferrochelatase [Roseivirga seohaensis]KOF01680.1 siroheme synthase [Roseivirga seohaensis subsp. aquiponti]